MRVYNWLKFIPSTLYPERCLLCGAQGVDDRDLCNDCAANLPHNHHPCTICALPLPPATPADAICGGCCHKRPVFDHCYAALEYNRQIRPLINGLKFHNRMNHARLFSQLMIDYLEARQPSRPDLILPVPLHRQRLQQRGFNQALELCRPLGRHFRLPIKPRLCRRVVITPAQAGLDRKARTHNLHHAFSVDAAVAGQSIALVDDVVTTGTTVSELARVLKQAGACRVDVWAVARTPHH